MKLSKLLAVGALALACLAFASPAVTAADVLDAPACTLDFLDPAPMAFADEVCAIDLDANVIFASVLSAGDEDESEVLRCSSVPAWPKLTEISGTPAAMRLPACRPNDPGWRIS